MNIKETALKVWDSNMIECPPENLTKFAEALVAELANENKPFAWYDGNKFYANEESASMACADMANLKPVFTSPLNIADIPLDRSDVDRAKKYLKQRHELSLAVLDCGYCLRCRDFICHCGEDV